jgi:hypothetical protein
MAADISSLGGKRSGFECHRNRRNSERDKTFFNYDINSFHPNVTINITGTTYFETGRSTIQMLVHVVKLNKISSNNFPSRLLLDTSQRETAPTSWRGTHSAALPHHDKWSALLARVNNPQDQA